MPAGRTSARTPMCIDRNDGDFLYRFLNAFSEGGNRSSPPISFSKVSHRVALETTVLPRNTRPSASLTPVAF